ncbi:MAG: hypothetical protein ACYSX0_00060 [Planctomycetota bacterium]|jgi:hypothetical protein
MRASLSLLLLLVGLVGARPGPDTALTCSLAMPTFRAPRLMAVPSCPPSWNLELTVDLPNPGWEVEVDEVCKTDDSGRRVIRISSRGKPGAWPQVITTRKLRVPLGSMRKGAHLLDLHYRKSPDTRYRRVQALVLDAK